VILVDTSVWIDHLRQTDSQLVSALHDGLVLAHPFVIGELALGNLRNRVTILAALRELPVAPVASEDEVLHFIDSHALHGAGIGYIDAHLLAAARLMPGSALWTRDKRLLRESERLGLAWQSGH
jgi:predicted nucleic acid-binding protein